MHAPCSFLESLLGLFGRFFFVSVRKSFQDSAHGLATGLEAEFCCAEVADNHESALRNSKIILVRSVPKNCLWDSSAFQDIISPAQFAPVRMASTGKLSAGGGSSVKSLGLLVERIELQKLFDVQLAHSSCSQEPRLPASCPIVHARLRQPSCRGPQDVEVLQ